VSGTLGSMAWRLGLQKRVSIVGLHPPSFAGCRVATHLLERQSVVECRYLQGPWVTAVGYQGLGTLFRVCDICALGYGPHTLVVGLLLVTRLLCGDHIWMWGVQLGKEAPLWGPHMGWAHFTGECYDQEQWHVNIRCRI
jgi:hypothetical protein